MKILKRPYLLDVLGHPAIIPSRTRHSQFVRFDTAAQKSP